MCTLKIWKRVVEASLKREVTISEQLHCVFVKKMIGCLRGTVVLYEKAVRRDPG